MLIIHSPVPCPGCPWSIILCPYVFAEFDLKKMPVSNVSDHMHDVSYMPHCILMFSHSSLISTITYSEAYLL